MDAGAIISKVLGFFKPPEFDQLLDALEIKDMTHYQKLSKAVKSMDIWGSKISWTFAVIAVCGGLAISPWGFLRAGEVEKKMEAAMADTKQQIAEIKIELNTIKSQTASSTAALNELLAQKVATDICRRIEQMKKETNIFERRKFREEVDELQRRHQSLDGEQYPEERCQ